MTTYKWSENLLKEFLKNPKIAAEFDDAFTFLRKGTKADDYSLSLSDVIFRDYTYLRLNSFCEEPIEDMLLASPNFFPESKYRQKISIPEALSHTAAFYGTLSPVIQSVFKEAFAIKDGRLMAVRTKNARFSGHCNTSEEAEDYLIDFRKGYDMLMNGTITHEFGHVVGFYLRDCENPPYSYHVFSEVESFFPEVLFYEFMENNPLYRHDAIQAQVQNFNGVLEDASLVLNKFDYHYVTGDFIDSPKFSLLSYKRAIDKMYEGESLTSYLRTIRYPAEDYLPYVYSYLIVVELIEIWRQSPKDAFDLYYRIVCLTTGTASKKNDALNSLGIIPGQNYSNYTRSLKKKVQGIKNNRSK